MVLIVIGLCAVNDNRVDNVGYVNEIGIARSCVRSQEIIVSLCQVRFAVGHTQSRRLLVVAIKLMRIVIWVECLERNKANKVKDTVRVVY